jgi:hypothetical protein
VALAENALTTLETAKEYLGLVDDNRDNEVERLINAASQMIENYCGRKLYYGEVTETVYGSGTPVILLSRYPVVDISEVGYYNNVLPVSEYDLVDGDLVVANTGAYGLWQRGSYRTPFAYTVSYFGGYVTPQQALGDAASDSPVGLTRTLPYDIEEACLQLVATLESRQAAGAVTDYRVGQVAERYASTPIPTPTTLVLEPYRAIRL